jgi:hypothetical protein
MTNIVVYGREQGLQIALGNLYLAAYVGCSLLCFFPDSEMYGEDAKIVEKFTVYCTCEVVHALLLR